MTDSTALTRHHSKSIDQALLDMSDAELVELQELLERERRDKIMSRLKYFARHVEVPGVPVKGEASSFRAQIARANSVMTVEEEDGPKLYYAEKLEPARHHDLIMDLCQDIIEDRLKTPNGEPYDGMMVFLPPGSAKALCLDTPIPTPSGWVRMGDLKIGDKVFDENGHPCNVTWVSPVHRNRPVYSVKTDCGDEIIADHDHEWLVRLCGKRKVFKIKETWELAKKRSKRPMIERAKALELPDADLPIDPYALGVWLGDGNSDSGGLTLNADDAPHIVERIRASGLEVKKNETELRWHVHGIRGKLVKLGLLRDPFRKIFGRKHIPSAYLRSSLEQRLSLLQGLVDTDGTVCKKRGCTTFTSISRELALQVRELVRSLGVKSGWSEGRATLNGKDCGPVFRVSFYHEHAATAPRKANLCRNQYRTPNTYVDTTLLDERRDTVCIEVDSPSHLFLCGRSMTPTHNSTYLSMIMPAYYAGRFKNINVVACSYGQDLANRFSRRHVLLSRVNLILN